MGGNIGDAAFSRGDVMREIADLKAQIQRMEAARRLESATVGSGGITIKAGGAISIYDRDGNLLARLGNLDVFGPGLRGVWLGRASGQTALAAYGTGENGDTGFVGLYDLAGNYVMTDDTASGRGVARPYIPLTLGEIAVPTVTTVNAAFEDLMNGTHAVQHPVMYASLIVRSDDIATTGEVRLTVDGVQIGDVVPVAGGAFAFAEIGPARVDMSDEEVYGTLHSISVQARRTAGAGTIGARLMSLIGLESAFL